MRNTIFLIVVLTCGPVLAGGPCYSCYKPQAYSQQYYPKTYYQPYPVYVEPEVTINNKLVVETRQLTLIPQPVVDNTELKLALLKQYTDMLPALQPQVAPQPLRQFQFQNNMPEYQAPQPVRQRETVVQRVVQSQRFVQALVHDKLVVENGQLRHETQSRVWPGITQIKLLHK